MTSELGLKAERGARARALLMAIGALVVVAVALLRASESARSAETWSWIALVLLWGIVIGTGGGLAASPRLRAMMNDELSLANRARALGAGFYAALIACCALLAATRWMPVDTIDAIRIITAAALATALARYAMLEWF